jgi:hypothetical protein
MPRLFGIQRASERRVLIADAPQARDRLARRQRPPSRSAPTPHEIEVSPVLAQRRNDSRPKQHIFVVADIGGGKNSSDVHAGDHLLFLLASRSDGKSSARHFWETHGGANSIHHARSKAESRPKRAAVWGPKSNPKFDNAAARRQWRLTPSCRGDTPR